MSPYVMSSLKAADGSGSPKTAATIPGVPAKLVRKIHCLPRVFAEIRDRPKGSRLEAIEARDSFDAVGQGPVREEAEASRPMPAP